VADAGKQIVNVEVYSQNRKLLYKPKVAKEDIIEIIKSFRERGFFFLHVVGTKTIRFFRR
jgi:hypothetical protein